VFDPESVWTLSGPDRTVFGDRALDELAAHLDAATTLVVRDPGLPDAVVERATAGLSGVETFDDVEPDPPLAVFEAALERARAVEPDAVVGVGGGSTMDVAKVTGALAPHGGAVLDYAAEPTGGGEPVPGPGVPVAAVPTTSGTGSETTPVAVVSLPDRDLKVGVSSRHLYPDLAVVDPVATVSLPPGPTAASGLDALAHAVEAYTTRRFDAKPAAGPDRPDYGGRTPLTDALCRVAIPRVGDFLRRAVDNGQDLAARRGMALASHAAGRAFSNAGLGAAHAVAMAAGSAFHTPHGETVGAVLPAVVRYNAPSAPERYAEAADWLGAGPDEDAADAVERLARDVGVGGLASLGVDESDVPALAERTMALERLLAGNPRRVDEDAIAEICRDAL